MPTDGRGEHGGDLGSRVQALGASAIDSTDPVVPLCRRLSGLVWSKLVPESVEIQISIVVCFGTDSRPRLRSGQRSEAAVPSKGVLQIGGGDGQSRRASRVLDRRSASALGRPSSLAAVGIDAADPVAVSPARDQTGIGNGGRRMRRLYRPLVGRRFESYATTYVAIGA